MHGFLKLFFFVFFLKDVICRLVIYTRDMDEVAYRFRLIINNKKKEEEEYFNGWLGAIEYKGTVHGRRFLLRSAKHAD